MLTVNEALKCLLEMAAQVPESMYRMPITPPWTATPFVFPISMEPGRF